MFRSYQTYFFICVITFLAFFHSGCSKKHSPKDSDKHGSTPEKTILDVIAPEKQAGLFTTKREQMCGRFHSLLNETLDQHILRNHNDKNTLLQHALSFLQSYPDKTEIDFNAWIELEENNLLVELPSTEKEQCALIDALSNKASFNLNLSEDNNAKLIETYLIVYQYFLNFSDGGLSKLSYGKDSSVQQKILGLVLLNRPDYSYALATNTDGDSKVRKPNYLFIQAVHPRSVLNQYRKDLVGKYIVALCFSESEENCLNINQQTLSKTLQELSKNEDADKLWVKLYKPDSREYELYALPLESLPSLYAYSYTYPSAHYSMPSFVIKIRSFRSEQLKEDLKHIFTNDIQYYIDEFGTYPKNIVIDLRENQGGYLHLATHLAEYFFPKKTLISNALSTVGKTADKTSQSMRASWQGKDFIYHTLTTEQDLRSNYFINNPPNIILLLNRRSASTSEIFAAAMKDHQAAMIIGEQSFGKFIGQSSKDGLFADIPMNRSLLQNYYFSPAGDSHFLKPQLLHKEHNNPFDQSSFVNIADYLSLVNFDDHSTPIASNPGKLDLESNLDTTPLINKALLENLQLNQLPAGCQVPSDFTLIIEEQDCLLDISDVYFSQLIELQ
ncbi:S41 family peptidase [bacterium]|nr:S41 family peptidase [bacterium]